jgi:hypothetical protein
VKSEIDVRRRTSLEDTPRDTGDQVVRQQVFHLCRGNGDGHQRGEQDETPEHDFFVAKSFGNDTVQCETEDFTAVCGLERGKVSFRRNDGMGRTYVTETGLPSCWYLIRPIGTQHAETSVELRESVCRRNDQLNTLREKGDVTHRNCPTGTNRTPPWRYTSR